MAWVGDASRRMCAGVAFLLVIITLAFVADSAGLPSPVRHLYLAPTLWAALVAGARAGGLTGLIAGLVQAPVTLPGIEWLGLAPATVDALLSLVLPLAFGLLVGRLVDQSRARAARLQAVLGLHRILNRDLPLEDRIQLAAEQVRVALGAAGVGLVIGAGVDAVTRAPIVASAPGGLVYDPGSAAAWTLRTGRPVFVRDLHADRRIGPGAATGPGPIRGMVLAIEAGSGPLGALAVERAGGFPGLVRDAAREMALHLALGVDNARLTLRQRHFAEELEGKVAVATERLAELDRAKSEFVSVVAHELRTPLTALQGFSELLLSRAVPPERATRFLRHLHTEAQRLGRIVSELLDLSRIETGGPPALRREPIDVNELLERNAELFAAQHRTHRFEWTRYGGMLALEADRDAVDRMLKNLISNAVKYSPAGGRVCLTARPADDQAGMLELAVEDDGVGISARDLPRIFDKYVRITSPQTATVRGLGLGLALVRALAEAHGGSVEVESLPGKGSRFRVLLPV